MPQKFTASSLYPFLSILHRRTTSKLPLSVSPGKNPRRSHELLQFALVHLKMMTLSFYQHASPGPTRQHMSLRAVPCSSSMPASKASARSTWANSSLFSPFLHSCLSLSLLASSGAISPIPLAVVLSETVTLLRLLSLPPAAILQPAPLEVWTRWITEVKQQLPGPPGQATHSRAARGDVLSGRAPDLKAMCLSCARASAQAASGQI